MNNCEKRQSNAVTTKFSNILKLDSDEFIYNVSIYRHEIESSKEKIRCFFRQEMNFSWKFQGRQKRESVHKY